MSHEVEKMFFTKQKPWWFGNQYQGDAIGTYVGEEAVDAAQAIRAADLDWDVLKVESAFRNPKTGLWMPAEGEKFLVRERDVSVLGRCTDTYVPFQNLRAFSFMDSLREGEGLRYHTAGSLAGGRKIWILAQLPGEFRIGRLSGRTNVHLNFLLLIAGHDGHTGINLMPTDVRAECANTCGYAEYLAEGSGQKWSVAHTASAESKLRIAASVISEIPKARVAQQELLQHLAEQRMTTAEFIDFATSIFLDLEGSAEEVEEAVSKWYEEASDRSKTIMENKVAAVTEVFRGTKGTQTNEGDTSYDALQAFVEHFDHKDLQARIAKNVEKAKEVAEKTVHSAWLGAGARRKALVMKRLRDGSIVRTRR